ncbi:MAG TPA: nucleotidyltransferase domain-containing protein [Longimicrobium sp.]|jgi:predicted nucleotidyltransferase|nr:nucleotidyltransferase domain-containing protein [Longimicrobium sp.]
MALQSLVGSMAMRRTLVHFAARPASRLHFRALERRLGLARQSLKNTLDTLEALGLVVRTADGRRVVYQVANLEGWDTLREMIRTFATPAEVIGDLFQDLPGVRGALVFGSAASGRMRPDSDVDVLVIAEETDAGALGIAALEAGLLLGRDIDLKRYTPAELNADRERSGTSYLKRAIDGATQWALGTPEEAFA